MTDLAARLNAERTEQLGFSLTDYDALLILAREAGAPADMDWNVPEQLGYYLADVPDATPAQIREAVQEFLDRDPRETP